MHTSFKRWFGLAFVLALALSAALVAAPTKAATAQANPSGNWVVAFNQPSGLPANVDQMVKAAGGTITLSLIHI